MIKKAILTSVLLLGAGSHAKPAIEKVSLDKSGNEILRGWKQTGPEAKSVVSGNGRFLFMQGTDDCSLYRKDLLTGVVLNLSTKCGAYFDYILQSNYEGNRVAFTSKEHELTVLDIESGHERIFNPQKPVPYGLEGEQMANNGKFVAVVQASLREIVIYNLELGTESSLKFSADVRNMQFSAASDSLLYSNDEGLHSIDLSNMTDNSVTYKELRDKPFCRGLDKLTLVCAASPYSNPNGEKHYGVYTLNLQAKYLKLVADLNLDNVVGGFAVSPSGRSVYLVNIQFDNNDASFADIWQTDLVNGTSAKVARLTGNDFRIDSLSASSGSGEKLFFNSNATNLIGNDTADHFSVYQWSE